MEKFDVIIIGCGPGGMEAAATLLRSRKRIAIVEKGPFGGVCLNCGCIPTKMLLGAIEPQRLLEPLAKRKIANGEIAINYKNLQTRVKRHIGGASADIESGLSQKGVMIYKGQGVLAGGSAVKIAETGEEIHADAIIIAAGSSPGFFPDLAADHKCVLDSTDLMFITELPQSLCVVGAGAIGLELADFFSALGSKIILVEAANHIAPAEDEEIANGLRTALARRGYEIHAGTPARKIGTVANMAWLELMDGRVIEAQKALIATGRKPNTQGLGCENANLKLDRRGFIMVNANLEAAPGIYAIGDINGKVLLAHAATQQGNYVARRILGTEHEEYRTGPVPSCIYCHPGIMRAGMSLKEAASLGEAQISRSSFSVNPIAQAHAAPEGFAQAVWLDGRLAGMSAIGEGATQLVTAAELLVAGKYDTEKLERLMIAHPSLDEVLSAAIYAERH